MLQFFLESIARAIRPSCAMGLSGRGACSRGHDMGSRWAESWESARSDMKYSEAVIVFCNNRGSMH